MPPIERIAHILAESGHSRADVTYFIERLQAIIVSRTLPHLRDHKLTIAERQRAYSQLLEGRSVDEAIAKRLRLT